MNLNIRIKYSVADETSILESIFTAIDENSKINVWNSLATQLDEISLTIRAESAVEKFDSKIKKLYNKCKDRLHLSMLYEDEKKGPAVGTSKT